MNSKVALGQILMGVAAAGLHYAVSIFANTSLVFIWAYYAFFLVSCLLISWSCKRFFHFNPDKVGLLFIGLMFAKMLLFALVFSPILFYGSALQFADKIKIIVPFGLFLILEVLAVYRILNPSN